MNNSLIEFGTGRERKVKRARWGWGEEGEGGGVDEKEEEMKRLHAVISPRSSRVASIHPSLSQPPPNLPGGEEKTRHVSTWNTLITHTHTHTNLRE